MKHRLLWFGACLPLMLTAELWAPLEPTADFHSTRLYARMALGELPAGVAPTITTPKPLLTGLFVPFEAAHLGEVAYRVAAAALAALVLALAAESTWLGAILLLATPLFADVALQLSSELVTLALLLLLLRSERSAVRALLLLLIGLMRPEAWLASLVLLVMSFASRTSAWRAPALIGLIAPGLWITCDRWLFGDWWFASHVTHLYQTVVARAAPVHGMREAAWCLMRAARSVVARDGAALLVLLAIPFAWRRCQAPLVIALAGAWCASLCLYAARGYPVFARFLDPLVGALLPCAATALVALARRWHKPFSFGLGATLIVLAIAPTTTMYRDLRARRATTDAIATALPTSRPPGTWLVDNDVASPLVANGSLAFDVTRNLQLALDRHQLAEPVIGIVIDDRFHAPPQPTERDARLQDLMAGWQDRLVPHPPGVRVLVRDMK